MYFKVKTVICSTILLVLALDRTAQTDGLDAFQEKVQINRANKKTESSEKIKHLGAHVIEMKDGTVIEEDENMFHPVDMPADFESYDVIDVDGFVTLEELANVTGAKENIELAFNASDKNGDGHLTKEEFDSAPWSLSFSRDDDREGSGNLDQHIDLSDIEINLEIDPEIKRYLLSDEELHNLQKSREHV